MELIVWHPLCTLTLRGAPREMTLRLVEERRMWLAGIPVRDTDVVELIDRLHAAELDTHADHLQRTLDRGARIVALDVADREAILRVLEDCPDELLELRATLTQEAAWRQREGF